MDGIELAAVQHLGQRGSRGDAPVPPGKRGRAVEAGIDDAHQIGTCDHLEGFGVNRCDITRPDQGDPPRPICRR